MTTRTRKTYRIYGHGFAGRTLRGEFSSRAAAVEAAKYNLRDLGHRYAIASRWQDGGTAIYRDRAERNDDVTGEGAAYLVYPVGEEN